MFDQATWSGAWSDALVGSAATATFNNTQYPIQVTNRGALMVLFSIGGIAGVAGKLSFHE